MKSYLIVLLLVCHFSSNAQTMDDYKIPGLTVAVTNMKAMVSFYEQVFEMEFQPVSQYQNTLYQGIWGGLSMLFCPAELAKNTATQNRHQFNIEVNDLMAFVTKVKDHGGTLMGDVTDQQNVLSVGIYDPDGNSLVVSQNK